MENPILPVESIQERDVDLILIEELCTDNVFCEWLVSELNLPKLNSVDGAWRSISEYGLGETDILFSYSSLDEKIFILIENKLDASFQENQFERYQQRAKQYIKDEKCDQAFVVLIAPNLYCENQNEFENYLSYETIASRLEFTGTKRNLFKSQLLKIATEKLRRGYQPVNSEPVQKFWHEYWAYKEDKHPTLYMKKPGIVPHGSDWPMLSDNRLKNITFYHKWAQGNSDATFWGNPAEVKFKIKENLPEGTELVEHGKSFSVRIFSGVVDRIKEFKDQVENVEKGIANLEKLRDWIINSRLLDL